MYYKNVRKLPDGSRVSQFITGVIGAPNDHDAYELEYKTGHITEAPEGSNGIYCYEALVEAIDFINGNTTPTFSGVVEVHEIHEVPGAKCIERFDSYGPRFTAIRLGKIVARRKVKLGYTRNHKLKPLWST